MNQKKIKSSEYVVIVGDRIVDRCDTRAEAVTRLKIQSKNPRNKNAKRFMIKRVEITATIIWDGPREMVDKL